MCDEIGFAALFLTALVAVRGWLGWRVRVRQKRVAAYRAGLCSRCGYDLRESHARCPECGDDLLTQATAFWAKQLGGRQ